MPVPIELRDFHALFMTMRNTYKGSRAKMPEIVMSRNLARKAFMNFPPSLMQSSPTSSANEHVRRQEAMAGWGGLLIGGARCGISYAVFAKSQVVSFKV